MDESTVIYTPLETQSRFHESNCLYRLFGGAAGGGKSKAMRMEAVRQCLSAPFVRGLIIRKTYKELWGAIIQPLLGELPKSMYKYNQSKNCITFDNITDDYSGKTGSSEINFGYLGMEKDVYQYQGQEYDFIGIDELTHFTEFQFKYLMSRLRSTKPNIVPNFFATTNPGGIGHTRVKRLWIDKQYNKGEKGWEFGFTPSYVYDNSYLVDNDPEYVHRLESLPDKERKALLQGDRDIFDGQFFKEYSKEIHTTDPSIPEFGKKIICMDYGYTNPTAIYRLNKGFDGEIKSYRELYITEHTYEQTAKRIKLLTGENEDIQAVVVDPAIFAKSGNGDNGISGGDIMQKILPRKIERANNDRLNGWSQMRQALQPFTDQNTGKVKAILQIGTNCENLIRTIPQMVHDKLRVEDLDSSAEDHACDSLRYGLMYLGVERRSLKELEQTNKEFQKNIQPKTKQSFFKKKSIDKGGDMNILTERF